MAGTSGKQAGKPEIERISNLISLDVTKMKWDILSSIWLQHALLFTEVLRIVPVSDKSEKYTNCEVQGKL